MKDLAESMDSAQNSLGFFRRFWIYQAERFPLATHGLMISIFTFSAFSYSLSSRGQSLHFPWTDLIIGMVTTVTLFLLVRIFDEFKDHEDDIKYRSYLPVPRGLISLKELGWVAWGVIALQVYLIGRHQSQMLPLYLIALGYLLLMRVEFFCPAWLKERQLIYITSHMGIIPLIDLYASGLDWRIHQLLPHQGILWFIIVSFFNGIALEFGRKIRTPEMEEPGVVSYTSLYGTQRGTFFWIALTFVTFCFAIVAGYQAGFHLALFPLLIISFLLCTLPGWQFLKHPTPKRSKQIENASGVWTILMYLLLGIFPIVEMYLS